jgi:hypothetical protein
MILNEKWFEQNMCGKAFSCVEEDGLFGKEHMEFFNYYINTQPNNINYAWGALINDKICVLEAILFLLDEVKNDIKDEKALNIINLAEDMFIKGEIVANNDVKKFFRLLHKEHPSYYNDSPLYRAIYELSLFIITKSTDLLGAISRSIIEWRKQQYDEDEFKLAQQHAYKIKENFIDGYIK